MIRDPLYKRIIGRLDDDLDARVFEHCAADLLRPEWPTLVPVPGGFDFGVDGVVGLAGPILVSTTQKNVLGNLKKSLASYVKSGGTIRTAILATSQEPSARRRKNLEDAARNAGFTLLPIYGRQAIADRIYPNKRWRLELLGLPGDPAALSLFPVSDRPLVGQPLIGRDADLEWLLKTEGDALLVGQPGSGKTFLMHVAARQGDGLFVVHDDPTLIANDLREMSPRFVVVDDAHVRVNVVRDLRRIRDEIGATFRILANSWPGDQERALRALGDTASSRQLELLTRDEIVEVLKGVGIGGPREVVYELVNQATGRPGLAVTLARLLLQGKGTTVATADALFADVRHTFSQLVGDRATTILAAFAVGGDWGMPLDAVADYLQLPQPDLLGAVTRLAAGGVLTDTGKRLSVTPAALRHALVRDTFFAGAKSLKLDPLLESIENVDETTLTLIGARARGGQVPDGLLHGLLRASRSSSTWSNFVRLGATEAKWVLTERPDLLDSVGGVALDSWPEGAIPRLLDAAVGDSRPLRQHSEHPLRLIGSWIASSRPGTGEAIGNRRQLAEEVISWINAGGDVDVAQQAMAAALSPGYEEIAPSPGSQRAITMTWGLVGIAELEAIPGLWPKILGVLSQRPPKKWSAFLDLIQSWLHPRAGSVAIPPTIQMPMTAFVLRMAQDIAVAAADRPGVLHMLRKILSRTDHELQVVIDPEFEILYPVREFGTDWEAEQKKQLEEARHLASQWITETPTVVAQKLVAFEREAALSSISWPRRSVDVCEQIAAKTDHPIVWAEAFRNSGASGELMRPFLSRLADLGDPSANGFLRESLDTDLRRAAAAAILVAKQASSDLVDLSLSRLDGMGDMVSFWCAQGLLSEELIARLLKHADASIASAAAGGLWHRERSQAVSRPGWRDAILATADEPDFNLEDVFRAHSDVAADWLGRQIRENSDVFWRRSHVVETAVSVLTVDQRRQLLSEMPVDVWTNDLIELIVGNDAELYQTLLETDRLKNFHLSPLHGHVDETWVLKARLAIQAGHPAQALVNAAMVFNGWRGSESQMWSDFVDRFEWLKQQIDEPLRTVGKIGSELASENRDKARARERDAAVHGYD